MRLGLVVVGSTARGGDTELSDCDFLADFAPGTTYFDLSDLVAELKSLLGCDVDVIPSEGLKPRKHARILEYAVPLWAHPTPITQRPSLVLPMSSKRSLPWARTTASTVAVEMGFLQGQDSGHQ